MKKISLIALVLAFLFVFMSASLASVSYDKDANTITISQPGVSFVEVWVNGKDTGRTLMNGTLTLKVKDEWLEAGSVSVTLVGESLENGQTSAGSVKVGETKVTPAPTAVPATEAPTAVPATEAPTAVPATPAPTAVPTAEPTAEPEEPDAPLSISASYKVGTVNYTVHGLASKGELWLDGKSVGKTVSNGSGSFNVTLDEGTHTLQVHNPGTGETETATFTVKYDTPVVNSVAYDTDGKLNYTVSKITNMSEVWVDGKSVGTTINGDGTYILSKKLDHGPHTLMVHNPAIGKSSNSVSFTAHTYVVTEAAAATCTKDGNTRGVVCSECGNVLVKSEKIAATGHDMEYFDAIEATCTTDGITAGQKCKKCNEATVEQQVVPALGHLADWAEEVEATCTEAGWYQEKCERCGEVLIRVDTPALGHKYICTERTVFKAIYECERCGDAFTMVNERPVKNGLGSIVKDATGKDVEYTAVPNRKSIEIVANTKTATTTEIGLYLDDSLIAQIKGQGFDTVTFVNDAATIVINLADIKAAWFTTDSAIWFYVFSTDPGAEGILVKVEAQVSGLEKVEAAEFTGVTLKKLTGDIQITANGIY